MADRDRRTGAALAVGGAGLAASAPAVPAAYAGARRTYLARQRQRLGNTGVADPRGRGVPVDFLPNKRGPKVPGGRLKSERTVGREKFAAERARLTRKVKAGPGRVGTALAVGQGALGLGLVGAGVRHYGRASEVGKAAEFISSQDLVGIAPWRTNPVDPLTMKASSSIMADILVGASGRNLSRRQKRRIRTGANRFVGAQHLVVTPTGMRGLVTA